MRRSGDDGFTLIELLVTIILLGVVTLPIGDALLSFIQNTDATTRRLSESHDAQISSAYFAQDVASIGVRSTTSPYALLQSVETNSASSALLCGTVGTSVVRFGWDDPTSATASTAVRVAYVTQTVSGELQLRRLVCTGSSTTPISNQIMVHNLDTIAPVVSCSTPTVCTGAGTAVPQSVTMVVSIRNPLSLGTTYAITLIGQRRQTSS